MKNRAATSLVALSLLVVFSAAAGAQTRFKSRLEIPFDFVVEGETLPAGSYTVGRADAGDPDVLTLASDDGRIVKIFMTQRAEAREVRAVSAVTFRQSGGRYFLSELWVPGSKHGRRLPAGDDKDGPHGGGNESVPAESLTSKGKSGR